MKNIECRGSNGRIFKFKQQVARSEVDGIPAN
jgi:hypothetical protein